MNFLFCITKFFQFLHLFVFSSSLLLYSRVSLPICSVVFLSLLNILSISILRCISNRLYRGYCRIAVVNHSVWDFVLLYHGSFVVFTMSLSESSLLSGRSQGSLVWMEDYFVALYLWGCHTQAFDLWSVPLGALPQEWPWEVAFDLSLYIIFNLLFFSPHPRLSN